MDKENDECTLFSNLPIDILIIIVSLLPRKDMRSLLRTSKTLNSLKRMLVLRAMWLVCHHPENALVSAAACYDRIGHFQPPELIRQVLNILEQKRMTCITYRVPLAIVAGRLDMTETIVQKILAIFSLSHESGTLSAENASIEATSAVISACKIGNMTALGLLLVDTFVVNSLIKRDINPLTQLCKSNHTEIVKEILTNTKFKNASIWIKHNDCYGFIAGSPLSMACSNGNSELVDLLLSKGSPIQDDKGHYQTGNALHAAVAVQGLLQGDMKGCVLKILEHAKKDNTLDIKKFVNTQSSGTRMTPLHYLGRNCDPLLVSESAQTQQIVDVFRVLCDHGADLTILDCKGILPLNTEDFEHYFNTHVLPLKQAYFNSPLQYGLSPF